LRVGLPFNLISYGIMVVIVFSFSSFTAILAQSQVTPDFPGQANQYPPPIADEVQNPPCNSTNGKPISIAVETDKAIYAPLEGVGVTTSVYDSNGCLIPAKVVLQIIKIDGEYQTVVYKQSFTAKTEKIPGFSNYAYFTTNEPGTYNVTATTTINGNEETSWKILTIQEFYLSRFAFMWFLGFLFFIGLVVLIIRSTSNRELNEVLRFTFISGIIFSILLSFIFINEKVSEVSPIGIVTKQVKPQGLEEISTTQTGIHANLLGNGEWVLNIGGQAEEYDYGIQIPVGILVFGIAGGYLRYLYKTSKLYQNYKEYFVSGKDDVRSYRLWLFYHSLEDISLLFLAPLLAIAIWLLLIQAGMQGQEALPTIAVISFSVGLITEEVVQALINFTKSALGTVKKTGTSKKK
jgi:hypothetical protein